MCALNPSFSAVWPPSDAPTIIIDVTYHIVVFCSDTAARQLSLSDNPASDSVIDWLTQATFHCESPVIETDFHGLLKLSQQHAPLNIKIQSGPRKTNVLASIRLQTYRKQCFAILQFQTDPLAVHSLSSGWDRERLYKFLFEQAKVGVVIRDVNTQEIVEINDSYLKLIGRQREDLGQFTFKEISHPEDQQKHQMLEARMKAGELREYSIEKRYIKKDGQYVWALVTCSAIWSPGSQPTQIIAIAQNIHQAKLTESTLRFIAQKQGSAEHDYFLKGLSKHLADALSVPHVVIASTSESTDQQLQIIASNQKQSITDDQTTRFPPSIWLINSRTPFISEYQTEPATGENALQYFAGVWLFDRNNHRQGLILVASEKPFENSEIVLSLLSIVSASVESDLTKKRSDQLIWNQANYDTLTNIPNRRLLNDRLHQEILLAQRRNSKISLLFLDLDNFKEINDSLGHQTGDQLLKMVAARLRSCVRAVDTVARFGGDEFAILVSNFKRNNFLATLAEKILHELSFPFQIDNHRLFTSCSIGITIYPDDSANLHEVLAHADQAMYLAKHSGKNRYRFFTGELNETVQRHAKLTRDLHQALNRNELFLQFQPILDVATQRYTKAEVLLRWQHPELGQIHPDEFIKIAEETSLIHDIGDWVFHKACDISKRIRRDHQADFQISLNKSPVQFRQQGRIHAHLHWCDYLKKIGLPGEAIIVEMTESTFIENSQHVADSLKRLREIGIATAIDDFGTGHSAMAYLRRYDIDYLKIDKEFIQSMSEDSNDYLLCQAIIILAHNLGMKVVAEGVETAEQLRLLCEAGADYLQGYLLSPPLTLNQLIKLLADPAYKIS